MKTRQYDVICAGLLVMDILATGIDRDLFERDTVELDKIVYACGGDALNVAINLSKLGAKVRIAGCLGDDNSGDSVFKGLESANVETSLVNRLKQTSTATSVVLCENNGERHFLHAAGANRIFDGSQISDKELTSAKALFVGSLNGLPGIENEKLVDLFRRAKKLGLITAMDACGSAKNKDYERIFPAFKYLDFFMPSLEEALSISGRENEIDAATFFIKKGVGFVVVKLGNKGIYADNGREQFYVEPFLVKSPKDTTGAGDSFVSGFIRGLLLDLPYKHCAKLGCAVSSSCVRHVGATTHNITLDEMCEVAGIKLSERNEH